MDELPGSTDVLIIGAGPSGLMMACQLAMHGINFRIIDKNKSHFQSSGALIIQARSLEVLQQMGIAEQAVNKGNIAKKVSVFFNGKRIIQDTVEKMNRNSAFPFFLLLEQCETEKLLISFIQKKGFEIERNTVFKSLNANEDIIIAELSSAGKTKFIHAKYLIAADGKDSDVRTFLNISSWKKTFESHFFILDCKAKTRISDHEIVFAFSGTAVAGIFPLKNSRFRIDGTIPEPLHGEKDLTFEMISKEFPGNTGFDLQISEVESFSVSRSNHQNASTMFLNRCFLVGDAAHVITPVGAQGMNTGLQDANNLAWKLALVLNQHAKESLLETYNYERLKTGESFSKKADSIFNILTSERQTYKFFRRFALKGIIKFLSAIFKNKKLKQRFFDSISQIKIQYRTSPLSYPADIGKFPSHAPVPGERFPFIEMIFEGRKTNSHSVLKSTSFNLLILSNALPEKLIKLARDYGLFNILIPLLPGTNNFYQQLGIKSSGYFLVRPDLYLAMRSATLDTAQLMHYLSAFFYSKDLK